MSAPVVASSIPAVLGSVGGDPDASRTVYGAVVVLVVIGIAFVALAVWLFKSTRVDLSLLAPLEAMSDRKWRKLDPASQRRLLDAERPAGARPLHVAPSVPDIDVDFESGVHAADGFDDLTGDELDLGVLDETQPLAKGLDDEADATEVVEVVGSTQMTGGGALAAGDGEVPVDEVGSVGAVGEGALDTGDGDEVGSTQVGGDGAAAAGDGEVPVDEVGSVDGTEGGGPASDGGGAVDGDESAPAGERVDAPVDEVSAGVGSEERAESESSVASDGADVEEPSPDSATDSGGTTAARSAGVIGN